MLVHVNKSHRFERVNIGLLALFLAIYLLWLNFFVGFRPDHLNFIVYILVLFFASEYTRKFLLAGIFFYIFWILYDGMRVMPNYTFNPIHITQPYELEKALFGINVEGVLRTPNEFFMDFDSKVLTIISGFFYLTWVPIPICFGIYLFVKKKYKLLLEFSAAFLFTNLIGFAIYYIYPAAPPWYVEYYGFDVDFTIAGNTARLLDFDQMVGIPVFASMYSKNANVFAAIPSLHASYPIVLTYYAWKFRYKIAAVFFSLDIFGIWFAAVFSMHHYIIDLILGAFCAIFAIFVFEKFLMQSRFNHWLNRYINFIG